MNRQETIKHLTDLMATIHHDYFDGRMEGHPLCVHERGDDSTAISIDLYHFGGDGKPVCDGLNPCTITYDDHTQESGWLYCMCYDPDDVTPLTFLLMVEPEEGDPGDINIQPSDVPENTLKNIIAWLKKAAQGKQLSDSAAVQQAKDIIAIWSDWCMDYDDENLWLDYMVHHYNGHCNRQHLQEKWDCCYEKYGSKAAMQMFWRELDNDNRTILTEYITTKYNN